MTEEMAANRGIDNGTTQWPKNYGSVKVNSEIRIQNHESNNYRLLASGETGYAGTSEEYEKRFFGIKTFFGSCLFKLYVVFYMFYLFSGGLVFSALEAPVENQVRQSLLRSRYDFLQKYPQVNEEALESLIEEVVRAGNRGVSASRNASGEPNWSFGQSIFFSSTVVTTIGYGHVTPLSRAGKVFCMAYAACGIPLTLVLLAALVERLLLPASALLRALNHRLGHLYQPFSIRLLHLFIIVLMLVIFFLAIPASVFSILEPEWDYLDSLYYCFISLTTIGLGDYIPGDTPNQPMRPLYKVATTVYLLVGLTFMMLTLTVYYDIPQLNVGLIFSSQAAYDPEKMRLSEGGMVGPQYTVGSLTIPGQYAPQCDDPTSSTRRSVVRVKPHRDDSPSPEDTTPVHARDIRVP